MSKLPRNLSGLRLREVLEGIGFVFQRQKGSHMVLRRANPLARVVVPKHDALKPGTLRQLLRDADLSVEDLLALLEKRNPSH